MEMHLNGEGEQVKKIACLVEGCDKEAMNRGICNTHLAYLGKIFDMRDEKVTDRLVKAGVILPRKDKNTFGKKKYELLAFLATKGFIIDPKIKV